MEQNTGFAFDADNLVLRGNFALEDGNFQQAEQFFEQALNFDAKCAEAYLGKFLVNIRCISLKAYIERQLQETAAVTPAPQPLQKNVQHIEQMAAEYAIKPRLTADSIRKMYQKSFSFDSCVPQRCEQRKQAEDFWNDHPALSRAERFATGSFAQKLAQSKQDYFNKLDQRITDAQTEEIAAQQEQLAAYEAFLLQTDEQVRQIYTDALRKKQKKEEQKNKPKKDTKVESRKKTESKPKSTKTKKPIIVTATMLLLVVALVIGLVAFLPKNGDKNDATVETQPQATPEELYAQAEELLLAGDPQGAMEIFLELGDFKDSAARVEECAAQKALLDRYTEAEQLLSTGDKRGALAIFRELADFKDAPVRAEEVRKSMMQKNIISAGYYHTVGLKADGTVVAVGLNTYGQCDVEDWTDIVAISAGGYHTVGLKADGKVVGTSPPRAYLDYGQCNVSGWTDIVAISTGEWYTVGLKADGTVVATGDNDDGRCDVADWTDIVAIFAGSFHTVGLKADGTVVAVGYNSNGRCEVADWTDIVAISAGAFHTVGLKADGTVVATGLSSFGRCDVEGWTDIVAISAGLDHTVGLKADGTVVATGYLTYGQHDVVDWTDIVAISADRDHTVGLKADGTVVTVGRNKYGQCDVEDWVLTVPDE